MDESKRISLAEFTKLHLPPRMASRDGSKGDDVPPPARNQEDKLAAQIVLGMLKART
jgi:hypothetical protein